MPCFCERDTGYRPKPLRRWQSRAFLEYVKTLPCSVPDCNGRTIEAAHMGARGIGRKVHDTLAIPLCREHHEESHRQGREWKHYEDIEHWQIQTMASAFTFLARGGTK
jgi:hypothetical protein